jgi:hypothetical protein
LGWLPEPEFASHAHNVKALERAVAYLRSAEKWTGILQGDAQGYAHEGKVSFSFYNELPKLARLYEKDAQEAEKHLREYLATGELPEWMADERAYLAEKASA